MVTVLQLSGYRDSGIFLLYHCRLRASLACDYMQLCAGRVTQIPGHAQPSGIASHLCLLERGQSSHRRDNHRSDRCCRPAALHACAPPQLLCTFRQGARATKHALKWCRDVGSTDIFIATPIATAHEASLLTMSGQKLEKGTERMSSSAEKKQRASYLQRERPTATGLPIKCLGTIASQPGFQGAFALRDNARQRTPSAGSLQNLRGPSTPA